MGAVYSSFEEMGLRKGQNIAEETFNMVANPSLIYADFSAFADDLACLDKDTAILAPDAAGQKPAKDAMSDWLIAAGAVLSRQNCTHLSANGRPALADHLIMGVRPPRYGRAAMFSLGLGGMAKECGPPGGELVIDVKGCGVAEGRVPVRERRGSGVLLLHEALQEVLNRKILVRIFRCVGIEVDCLPIYALVGLGITGWCSYFGFEMPCVTMVRRGHCRPPDNDEIPVSGSDEEKTKHAIELILRHFGISSAPTSCSLEFLRDGDELKMAKNGQLIRDLPGDLIEHHLANVGLKAPSRVRMSNVQMTNGCSFSPLRATLVDFGHYTSEPRYDGHQLLTLVSDRPFNWGLFSKECDDDWVQPLSELLVTQELVGPVPYPPNLAQFLKYPLALRRWRPGVELAATQLALRFLYGDLTCSQLDHELDRFAKAAMPRAHSPLVDGVMQKCRRMCSVPTTPIADGPDCMTSTAGGAFHRTGESGVH